MYTSTYTFYHLPNKEPVGLYNKIVQGYLLKWCVHLNLKHNNSIK